MTWKGPKYLNFLLNISGPLRLHVDLTTLFLLTISLLQPRDMAQIWTFETPVNVTAISLVNITWNPRTLDSVKYGNFLLNLWLLRGDYQGDTEVREHEAFLLAGDQDVFNASVLWTPTIDDIDFNVSEAGTHQLSWEQSKNNPSHSPFNTSFEGWSRGFHVKALPSASSSSVLSPTSTSTFSTPSSTLLAPTPPVTSSISQDPASDLPSQSRTNTPIIIGLVIGLSLLLLIFLTTSLWGVRKYRLAKKQNRHFKGLSTPSGYPLVPNSEMSYNSLPSSLPESTPISHSAPISRSEMDSYPRRNIKPAELAAPRIVAEL
ncbi:a01564e7-769c-40d1-9a3b-f2c75a58670d [Sclerotinia trifoliorum]|uniref:A01564e7-769c-40d1-9a3b-f2c75a58670d n=1 Tax=Sclerotinia trifoliorum TaxID=28548 RepID=A0A8H2W2E9_9HELO|nr:a01564e7-769c-40d1-9a3b-f2c75a58670d [Sclerotinia trifoliorum]